ncbi:XRE family transcriptional regulator [Kribbella sp. NBC_01505]|uniref:XRE family transcriptional regulator n=1 Tax=Kribbella sp. NBC_01505 TaxID=2903580 RepID=UPI0038641EB7
MNTVLRRAMYDAGLTELDLSVELAVDPKTVRNWMHGQVPHPGSRAALSALLDVDASVLWPSPSRSAVGADRPAGLVGVYPRSAAISHADWLTLFADAESQIGILASDVQLLLKDRGLVRILRERSGRGIRVRIVVASTGGSRVPVELRDAGDIELRFHEEVLYNSMYIADDQLLVNQHSYGVAASESPVYHYRRTESGEMYDAYLSSFEIIWSGALGGARTVS